jgi:hypothetical protein
VIQRAVGHAFALVTVIGCLLALGCGGGSAARQVSYADSRGRSSYGDVTTAQVVSVDSESTGGGASGYYGQTAYTFDEAQLTSDVASATTASTGSYGAEAEQTLAEPMAPQAPPPDLYAQAQTSTTTPEATATDAVDTSGELLIYTALFHIGVYDVGASQAAIVESARSVGGFVFQQSDDRIIVRVPAPRFRAFVETVEGVGDVLHRQIDAQDVGEEFRDVEIRIRNLEAVRDRIAALLERGLSVEQVLVVERELERVTSELERMRGRQRYLADHIAFSTITVLFQPAPREAIDQPDVFQLPFSWLDSLGLSNLLNLR